MKALVVAGFFTLALAGSLDSAPALADKSHHPLSLSRASHPSGARAKASSFAPRARHSGRHVYGAPIQPPILTKRSANRTRSTSRTHSGS
jgi:hypothetical protein